MKTLLTIFVSFFAAGSLAAEGVRVATFNASLTRSGPGLLLRDLTREDPQIAAVVRILQTVRPDILLLNEFDYDGGGAALTAFQALLATAGEDLDGLSLPHAYAGPVNTGLPSGLDLNGDGTSTGPEDAFGFGRFPGQYGMAILSRYPIDHDDSYSFRIMRWADMPGAQLPVDDSGAPFPSADARAVMRLSSKAHWDVAILTPQGPLRLLAAHPTPPVFDGPEDANGLRNRDEIRFWISYIDGQSKWDDTGAMRQLAEGPFVVAGDLNADPFDGDGIHAGIRALLDHPRIQDPAPTSAGGVAATDDQAEVNLTHDGPAAQDTADWRDTPGPGNLRVDYVLPSADMTVHAAGVFWPAPGTADYPLVGSGEPVSSDHRLVWVDLSLPGAE